MSDQTDEQLMQAYREGNPRAFELLLARHERKVWNFLRRSVGDRLARRAILSGLEFEAGTPNGDLLCDEVVEPGAMDAAVDARIEALTSSGLINAASNRRAMRVGEEPLETFRAYMATFVREQARLHYSPALVANLERHWNAHERTA